MNAGVTENYDGDSDNELGATSKEIEGSSDLGGGHQIALINWSGWWYSLCFIGVLYHRNC